MMQSVGTQSYMQPAQAPAASAVNIQIFEPKAYAAPNGGAVQDPVYSYPQQSVYSQPYANQYQQYMPQQAITVPQYQPQPMEMAPAVTPAPAEMAQQPMPAPVLNEANQTTQLQGQTPATPAPVDMQPAQNPAGVDVDSLVAALQGTDNKAQEDAITKIANLSQGSPEMQNAVLTEPVMKALSDVVKQDTTGLQGPTDAQKEAINKAASGAQLTPEEEALTKELAPKTAADKNRVIAMFTLAMLQKNQRDEIDRYNQTQDPQNQVPQFNVADLIGYNEIENAARNDQEKEVKLAAIQALSYVARPEDKEKLEPVMTAALQDSEPLIQQAATEVLANMGSAAAPQAPAQDAQATEAQPAEAMSKKEKKAMEKAQKKAEKEAKKAQKQ